MRDVFAVIGDMGEMLREARRLSQAATFFEAEQVRRATFSRSPTSIVGGHLHGRETVVEALEFHRLYRTAGVEVWIPDAVQPGDEPAFIARARILGGEL